MNKVYTFIIIVPIIAMLLFRGIAFYEYDTKQRYIKDLTDSIVYEVKITGVLTTDEYNSFRTKIGNLAKFDDSGNNQCVILQCGQYENGVPIHWVNYTLGSVLHKGDAFSIYVKSSDVSNYSRLQNGGKSSDDTKNLYYRAKAECEVEYNN